MYSENGRLDGRMYVGPTPDHFGHSLIIVFFQLWVQSWVSLLVRNGSFDIAINAADDQ